ncbi:hypothetical protein CAPTEDRAFT_211210 [Capitella teleta]|uniref:Carbohydrate sulfotransferase n=1 Tax=Capitella teleta TaxID=283909 RepID=R7V8Q4_CAPTE|nr:hypothetical protein CAPTEDRAFT_211210 [Capitella teleta]|eukprot:ELU12726.1 hypothetical protein CAPTEDRAFT_211210 [Capitella teleta]
MGAIYDKVHGVNDSEVIHTKRITFSQFVDYLIDPGDLPWDEHWSTYDDLCDPCGIQYDYILKMETLQPDIDDIRARTGIVRKLGHNNQAAKVKWRRSATINDLWSLPAEKRQGLFNVYKTDFEMFGYSADRPESQQCNTPPSGCC